MKNPQISLKPSATLKPRSTGFTLIELLTVIAIIGILAAILIVGIGKVKQSANSAASMSLLRQSSIAILSYVNESGYYPKTWGNENSLSPAKEWYGIPQIREALGDTSSDYSNNLVVSQSLRSPLVESERALTPEDPIVNNYALSPGPGNRHPNFNPRLTTFSVDKPSELILLADTAPGPGNRLEELGDGQHHMWQLNNLTYTVNEPEEKVPGGYDALHGWAKMDFDRHGNGKTHVTFCDGHVEMRAPDEFYYKNFQVP